MSIFPRPSLAKQPRHPRLLVLGLALLAVILLLPYPDSEQMYAARDAADQMDCATPTGLSASLCKVRQKTSQKTLLYLGNLEVETSQLKGKGYPSDFAQDVVGFRHLLSRQNPYPRLTEAHQELGLNWPVDHASTHPPTAFLLAAPVALLPWNLAAAAWAWLNLCLLACTLHFSGLRWQSAVGLTPFVLLWPPVFTSLSQLTIVWFFCLAAAWRYRQTNPFASGLSIGAASLTKYLPALMMVSFLVKKQWRAFFSFALTWVAAILLLLLLHPGSLGQYLIANRSNSLKMILRDDNAALLPFSYRLGGWAGVALVSLFFLVILVASLKYHREEHLAATPRQWRLLTYFSVVLLPIAWIYALTPLLPVIVHLVKQKKLSTLFTGFLCLGIPFVIPAFGPASAAPIACVYFLAGLGLLFDALPFRLFTAAYLKDLFS